MTPVDLAVLLKDYGPWGLLALALLTCRWLFGKYEQSQQARIEDGRIYAGAVRDNAAALIELQKGQIDQSARLQEIDMKIEYRIPRQ